MLCNNLKHLREHNFGLRSKLLEAGHSIPLPFRTRYPPRVDTERNDTTATSKGVVPPRFRRIPNFVPFRPTEGYRSAKLIFRFRYASAEPIFFSCSVSTKGGRSANLIFRLRYASAWF